MSVLLKSALLVSALIAMYGCSSNEQNSIPIVEWKICKKINGTAPNMRDSCTWEPYHDRNPLQSFLSPFHPEHAQAILLRGKFNIPNEISPPLATRINCRNRIEAIYINSSASLLNNSIVFSNLYAPIVVSIPLRHLQEKDNYIYIKTILIRDYSAIPEYTRILDETRERTIRSIDMIIYSLLPLAILIFNFSFFLSAVIFFLWNRKERIFLIAALILFVYFLFITFLFIPPEIIGSALSSRIHLALLPILALCLVMIVQSLYRIYLSNFNRAAGIICLAVSLLLLMADQNIIERYSPYFFLCGISILISSLFYMLHQLNRIKPDRFNFIALSLFIVYTFILSAFEMKTYLSEGQHIFLTTVCSAPLFIIVFVVLIGRELMRSRIEMKILYSNLKKPVRNQELVITESTEEKLSLVIEFIKLNYTRNLSREGLAGAVDISTDYMSRLFRKFTGKKINEYVNMLRIEEAKRRLADKDVKIIDIALSIGFESLSTFNRIFKSETGMTPTRYRSTL